MMPLQHQVRAPMPIPELDTTITRTGDDPLAIMRDSHRPYTTPVAREIQHTFATLFAGFMGIAQGCTELPILEFPVG